MHNFTPRESAGKDVAEPLRELEPSIDALAHVMVGDLGQASANQQAQWGELRERCRRRLRSVLVLAYRRGALDAVECAVGGSGS